MRQFRSPLLLATAVVLSAALSGCVIAPARPYYAEEGPVPVAPPAPQYEVVGVAPVLGHIWINGFWRWSGGRHHWQGGRWEAPRPGHHWVPHQWRQERGGWRLHGGHWGRR